jgi:protein-S-isoprenylcysteine O-methyltransferase Ste14
VRRFVTVLRHVVSIIVLPTMVTGVVPYVLLARGPSSPSAVSVVVGAVVAACGLSLVVITIRQFATFGRGTLAPWDPPRRLVVEGIYRYVRNPMITGVILILLGEAVGFRSRAVAHWVVLFAVINATYIPLLEEPMLEERFGEDYREYCRNVPRWIPRSSPWVPTAS